jgi:hypothetical protein
MSADEIVFAILAKDKAAVLPLYLRCLLNQTIDKKRIHLYIRTNDNTDRTEDILKVFLEENGDKYASVFFDASSVTEALKKFKPHEWNSQRFKILGRIRQDSVDYAKSKGAHYFVADCDNFIIPTCLEKLLEVKGLGVVAPMLISTTRYLNIHYATDANGYLKDHPNYDELLQRRLVGCVKVDVVHCTYFISANVLDSVCYDDNSYRYEYVIFSDCLRKKDIGQYIDNRFFYGFLTFADTAGEFDKEINTHWKSRLAIEYGISYSEFSPFKETYSDFGEDKEVLSFYSYKDNGFFVAIGTTAEANTYLLQHKYNWKGLKDSDGEMGVGWLLESAKAPTTIDYMSLAGCNALAVLNGIDLGKYKFGFITIENDLDKGIDIYTKLIDNGYVFVTRDSYDIYIHKSMFEGEYFLNGNKLYPHSVKCCNITNTISVTSQFPWSPDSGRLNTNNMYIYFDKIGKRKINYNSIKLHDTDVWVKY